MRKLLLCTALAFALAGPVNARTKPADAVAAALADPARPEADKARDANRKPAEILAFAGVEPGDSVGDFIMGGGYFTRILAKTVGPKGRVYAYQADEFIKFNPKYGEDQKAVASAYANVTRVNGSLGAVSFPAPLDLIFTAQNYHDLHLKIAPTGTAANAAKALLASLKPGGTLLVIDHMAADGSGTRDADTLHRIDAAAVRQELEAAGFRFDGESQLLRNPADPRTAGVFDPSIRGKTDQFVYRFRKPR